MKKTFTFFNFILLTTIFSSCDPYYSITITNETNDKIQILVIETVNFNTDKEIFLKTIDGFDVYELAPNEKFQVGSAIAEIDNDIPFEQIKIVSQKDTLKADNIEAIKNLFDKKMFGGLKTPYNITIKK